MRDEGYDVSLSGLKTAVVRAAGVATMRSDADVAASFQAAVVDVLASKLERALDETGAATVAVGGGVAANSALRAAVASIAAAGGSAVRSRRCATAPTTPR